MSRFKPGQQVICIDSSVSSSCLTMPKKDEIVTVAGDAPKEGHITLCEYQRCHCGIYRAAYPEHKFEPLITDEELIEELSSIPEVVEG